MQVALATSLVPPEATTEVNRTAGSAGHAAGRGPRLTAPISTVVALRPDGLCVETIEVELRAASDLRFDRDGATPLRIRGVAADDATLDAYVAALGRHRFLGAVEETLRHPSRCGGRGFEIGLGPIESPVRPMVVHRVAGAGGGR